MNKSLLILFAILSLAFCTSLDDESLEEDSGLVSNLRCDYCKLKPFGGKPNTYCKYKKYLKKPHPRCLKGYKFGIKNKDAKAILKAHNDYRRKVANGLEPKLRRKQAADMMELTWDIELAKGAQMWANQCLFEHDGRRTCKFNWIGQNSFRAFFKENPSSRTENWKGYIDGWYAEVNVFAKKNQKTESYKWDASTGHFTQVIWAKTTKVGCGYIAYKGSENSGNNGLLVCNYGIGGNQPGKPIFTAGKKGSKCPRGSYNNRGLCKTRKREDENESLEDEEQEEINDFEFI